MKKMFNEGNQTHNFISSSGSGTVINYGSGSDFLTSYGSGYGSGSGSGSTTLPLLSQTPTQRRICFHSVMPTFDNFLNKENSCKAYQGI
jgi:hypothetical protein